MEKISIRYRRSDFLPTIFHFSMSAVVRTGSVIRTAAIESKRALQNGSLIILASAFLVLRGIFRYSRLMCGSRGTLPRDFAARLSSLANFRSSGLDLNRTK